MRCGIVGLPNVGKSTFFNLVSGALLAPAENYPFCTIEPHNSVILVPDNRLSNAAKIVKSREVLYAAITMVDIAGLIEGASKGEGLGNKFLQNIESCDVLLHMVRCYDDDNVIHVMNRVSPIDDIAIVDGELIISDMQRLENKIARASKKVKDKTAQEEHDVAVTMLDILNNGGRAHESALSMNLLTTKPVLYVCNVSDSDLALGNNYTKTVVDKYGADNVVLIAAKFESDLMSIEDPSERQIFMQEMGIQESGLDRIIRKCYKNLGVHSFFTVGPKEARAWTIKCGDTAFDAAGKIHSDFQKGFIRAEVISYTDFVKYGGEHGCKNAGVARAEGRDYIVQDADIINFRFNV